MTDCVYCSLPEFRARKIVENDFAEAYPTNIPITPGHTLVIPKRHVQKYEDLTPEEKFAIEDLRMKIAGALKKLFHSEGFHFAWNESKVAGQSIPHFHLHIVPRKPGDEGITQYEPRVFLYRPGSREKTEEAELQAVAAAIREAIG